MYLDHEKIARAGQFGAERMVGALSWITSMLKRPYSILVVDDNPADLFIIREAFSECGFRCHLSMASSMDEARQMLSRQSFDLLLSDFGADADEGRNFIRSIRAQYQSLPIVVLSGGYNATLAYESGANAFVRKPNDLKEFTLKMTGMMNFWVDIAELPAPATGVNHRAFVA